MPYNADQNEKEILEFWQKNQIFEKSVSERPENRPYVFYDGPPFATGLPHYGHILSSVIKDVVPRYWTMKGYRVRRRWGWDCHGLPIENIIEKELKVSGKKDIEEKIGVEKFNNACRSKVLMYTHEWKKMVDRIGRWVEFDNSYKTMDSAYMESVWWALKTIWDKGLIYEGRKVLMYCPRCETPVSKAEVAMDNSYKDITEESVVVKFRIKNDELRINNLKTNGPVYILAWTTTPWTLPGNVALAVGESINYVVVEIKDDAKYSDGFYIMSEDYFEKNKIHGQGFGISQERREGKPLRTMPSIIKRIKGKDLIGLEYEPLFEVEAVKGSGKKAWYVAPADFVTTEEGTGVVHTAVIYGEDDYNLGLKLDLPMVPLLDEKGHFNSDAPELIRGQYFKKSEKAIKEDLEKRGLLFSKENFAHSYPHCWRCDTQLFYNAISAWFINIQKIKDRLIKLNEKVNWYPEHLKHGRFLNILETAPDWNISRNRYWATPLPFWRCVDVRNTKATKNTKNEGCGHLECVGSVEELKEKAVNFKEVYKTDKVEDIDLHKDQMDKIKLKCPKCKGEMTRIPEVIDCWVESGSMPFAEFHYPFENKKVFEERFPGQYIAEYIAQTRAWFYYMHVMATLLFDDVSFKNCVTTGTILNEKGEKLSKSKMNYTDPWKIIEQYGVDALRYYLMTSVVMEADDLSFNDREVRDVYNKVVNILWNVVEFYKMYSPNTTPYSPPSKGGDSENVLDKWILAKLNLLVKEVTENMDNYNTVRAGRPIKDFIDELSTWYVRRSRERFKGTTSVILSEAKDPSKHTKRDSSASPQNDKQQAVATLREVLLTLSELMAPFTPFIAEKIYQTVRDEGRGTRGTESVHLEEWPEVEKTKIEIEIIEEMDKVRKIVEVGLALRAEAGVKVKQPLAMLYVTGYRLQDEMKEIIADELNVKEVKVVKEIKSAKDWAIKEEAELKIALSLEITPELKKEGLLREVIRAINLKRKEQKLFVGDSAVVEYETDDPELAAVFKDFAEEIKKATVAKEIKAGQGEPLEIDGRTLWLSVHK